MKVLAVLICFVFAGFAGFGQEASASTTKVAEPGIAVFESESLVHDFGKIPQGTPVTHEFKFTNSGKTPLVITHVQASCGCTTPAWSKDPIPPGGEGFVKATFNAASMGGFNKTITVMANVEHGFKQLTVKGEVIK